MFSGGTGSWGAAKRVAERHGTDDLILLFADTLIEDEDLYRYLHEAAGDIGGELVRLEEGRDPWEVFFDRRYLGNTRVDPCSMVLKRDLMRKWLERECDPEDTIVYLGFDWTEVHRFDRAKPRWEPWRAEAPLCESPLISKEDLHAELEKAGIEPPRLYAMGFKHNNCGGFCVKAGQAQFAHLLRMLPERYRYHEEKEQELREFLGKDVAILKYRSGPKMGQPMTLREFRERQEEQPSFFDASDDSACGMCMV
jgi:hypothetical protein